MAYTMINPSKLRKIGRSVLQIHLKGWSFVAFFLLASLIMSGITVATSSPLLHQTYLNSGESIEIGNFYADTGEKVQLFFSIVDDDYEQEYSNHDNTNNDIHQSQQEFSDINDNWLIQMIVYHSESMDFKNKVEVVNFSGITNVKEFTTEQGFYVIEVRNLDQEGHRVSAGKTEVSYSLAVFSIIFWILFGVSISLMMFILKLTFFSIFALGVYVLIKNLQDDTVSNQSDKIIEPRS